MRSLRLSVIKVVIVDNGQSIRLFIFLHKIEWVCMVLRILNLDGCQNGNDFNNVFGPQLIRNFLDLEPVYCG